MTEVAIDLVSLDGMFVLLADGETIPIANLFDDEGDECGAEDAVSLVAGPTKDGKWISCEISDEDFEVH